MVAADQARVEAELNRLTAAGGKLHKDSDRATFAPGTVFPAVRLIFHRTLIDQFLDQSTNIAKDGRAAIVTAGPPGAGRSSAIGDLHLAGDGFRVIDPDAIKTLLLRHGLSEGRFDDLLTHNIADGHPIMLNELSSLVHNESTMLAENILTRCLRARENVVIEGTLSWSGLGSRYLENLEANDYRHLTILDVEVSLAVALERARARWVQGREAAINGADNGGGRFTPEQAITWMYSDNEQRFSCCNENAVNLFKDLRAADFTSMELIVQTETQNWPPASTGTVTYRRRHGDPAGPVPEYLKNDPPPEPTRSPRAPK